MSPNYTPIGSKVKKILYKALNNILRPFGLRIERVPAKQTTTRDLVAYALRRTQTGIVVDVGAADGTFIKWIRELKPNLKIYAFEPLPHKAQQLRNTFSLEGVQVIEKALSDTTRPQNIYRTKDSDSSSLLKPMDVSSDFGSLLDIEDIHRTETSTLDLEISLAEHNQCALLKLDAQGNEAAIIRGGFSFLSQTNYIILEVALKKTYENQPLIDETMVALSERGFKYIDFAETTRGRRTGELYQLDVLFGKDQKQKQ